MTRRISWSMVVSLVVVMSACGGAEDSTTEPPASHPAATSTTMAITTTSAVTTTAADEPVVWPTDGWPAATPESQGMDSEALARHVERLTLTGGVDSLMVVRNGHVVVDAVFHPFPAGASHNLYSVSKSFVGTLIGIAIDRGLLAGVDTPVVEILAEDAPYEIDDRKAVMTVEDLLTMSQGFECRDDAAYNYEGLTALLESDDWTAHVLSLPMIEEPGTRFHYCNQSSFLLSAILTEVTGKSASEFAAEALFEPLGITEFEWAASPDGISLGFSDLMLEPLDMAKLGYLYLHEGQWDGEQVVSPEWVAAATHEQIDVPFAPHAYGYQWWIYPPLGYVMAQGYGGQYVVVDAARDLLVAITATAAGFTAEGMTNQLIREAVLSDGPLAANAEGEARLASALSRARAGPEPEAIELPALASVVSGVRYRFEPNDTGLASFVLEFGDETAVLELSDGVEHVRFAVGIDGRFAVTESEVATAMLGRWQGDSTFVITSQTVGMADPAILQLGFANERVHVRLITSEGTQVLTAARAG